VSNQSNICSLLRPLRIEYEWSGCFVYNLVKKGHTWLFDKKTNWKRLEFKYYNVSEPDAKWKEITSEFDLIKLFKYYDNNLKGIQKKAEAISNEKLPEGEWQFADWFRDEKNEAYSVGRGLSIVLNALVQQATLKPFELLASFVGSHITVEVRGLGEHTPCWFYLKSPPFGDLDEYLVCFPELFLEIKKNSANTWILKSNIDETLKRLLYLRVKHHYQVVNFQRSDEEISVTLRDKASIVEYSKGAKCYCIPVPGKCPHEKEREEPQGVNSPEVIVSSPVVSKALADLSRIWQNPKAKSVLISSPPGSGKETLAKSISYGNGRPPNNVRMISLASEDQNGLQRQLYGFKRSDGSIEDGLIAHAADSVVFLDEIHQPEKEKTSSTRASLLRVLESEKYLPMYSLDERDVDNVMFVMATSKKVEELEEFRPVDFWTRVEHVIEIPHPLDLRYRNEKKRKIIERIVADFFRHFWWDLCDKQYKINPLEDPNKLPQNKMTEYWQQRSMLSVILDNDAEEKGNSVPKRFAEVLMEQLKTHNLQPNKFSIRGIRNMVTRVFAIAWAEVAQGQEPWPGDKRGDDIRRIFAEIQNVARLDK